MGNVHLYFVILLHVGFAAALTHWPKRGRFVRLFAMGWFIEALRAAILLPQVHSLYGLYDAFFFLADILNVVATWLLVEACAELVGIRLSKRLRWTCILVGFSVAILGRFVLRTVLEQSFGFADSAAEFYAIQFILTAIFIPVVIGRMLVMVWLFKLWRETRLSGALIAGAFAIPYAVFAMSVPFQHYFEYFPEWINLLWIVRVFGFSMGILMYLLSAELSETDASERRYRALFEQALIGVAEIQSQTGVILRINDSYSRMIGCDAEDLVGKTLISFIDDTDLLAQSVIARRIESTERVRDALECRHATWDGGTVWVNLTISPVHQTRDGQITYLAVAEDISARKMAEFEVRERETELRVVNASLEQRVEQRTSELRQANDDLEAYARTVAHDLRAPLRAMYGFASALREDFHDRLDADGLQYVDWIESSAQRMDHMIQDLLAYSMVCSTQLHLEPVDLDDAVDQALEQHVHKTGGQQVEISVKRPLGRGIAHLPMLVQVIGNLVSNAVKFVDSERPAKVCIESVRSGNTIRLLIKDNGIGIDEQHTERIFNVFERLHDNSEYSGTGIGLAVVRRAIESMNGRIGVQSTVGQGSQFWFQLRADTEYDQTIHQDDPDCGRPLDGRKTVEASHQQDGN